MPQHKSAKKRVKTNLKSQTRNRAARSTLKRSLKAIQDLPEDERKKPERSGEWQHLLDKASRKGLVHRNKAARLKSRFLSGK